MKAGTQNNHCRTARRYLCATRHISIKLIYEYIIFYYNFDSITKHFIIREVLLYVVHSSYTYRDKVVDFTLFSDNC